MDALGLTEVDERLEAFDGTPASEHADERPVREGRIVVEALDLPAVVAHQRHWSDLCGRALEPNIFLEPAFCLPLVQHVRAGRRPTFLLVWADAEDAAVTRLVGLLLVSRPATRLDPVVRGFASPQSCLGVPLLDRSRADEAWAAILDWLRVHDGRHALALSTLPRDGAVFRRLIEPRIGTGVRVLAEHQRAVLRPALADATMAPALPARRRKELRRQGRRLAERGVRTFASARTPSEIRAATERFLALEHRSWKGARGSALLADPTLATFTRSMTRLMAQEGKCRIDSLDIDGQPVAMGIVLTSGGRAHFWKTAFDEQFATLSPGVQLALAITDAQVNANGLELTDSCAAPDHPMIDRLWPDRMTVADVLINLRDGEPRRFAMVDRLERLYRTARQHAKRVVGRVRQAAR